MYRQLHPFALWRGMANIADWQPERTPRWKLERQRKYLWEVSRWWAIQAFLRR